MSQGCVKVFEVDDAAVQSIRNPRSWIARVLHNLCADRGRANGRSRTLADNEAIVPLPAPAPAPDRGLSRSELADALTEAVLRLPTHLREVVILRLVEELSYADIRDALEISIPNARKRLQQARALLRPDLAPYWAERLDEALFH